MIQPEVTTIVGTPGTGKTTLAEALVAHARSHIAMTTKPSGFMKGWVQVTTWQELLKVLVERYHHKSLKVCVRVVSGPRDLTAPVDTMNGVADALFEVQKKALQKGSLRKIGLMVDEAQVFCPHGNVRGAAWIATQGREWGIQPTFATQQPTSIPPIIRDNSKNWFVLMLGGANAINTIKQAIPSLRNPKQFRYHLYRENELVDEGSTRSPKKIIHFP